MSFYETTEEKRDRICKPYEEQIHKDGLPVCKATIEKYAEHDHEARYQLILKYMSYYDHDMSYYYRNKDGKTFHLAGMKGIHG